MSKLVSIVIIFVIIGIVGYFLWQIQRGKEFSPKTIFLETPLLKKEKPITEEFSALTPQEVFRNWFKAQIEGNWNIAFNYMVDIDKRPYSFKCQEAFKKAFNDRVGAEYTLKIEENEIKIKDCRNFSELIKMAEIFGFNLPEGECAIVPHSFSITPPQGVQFSETDTFISLFKVDDQWKVMVYCKPLLD